MGKATGKGPTRTPDAANIKKAAVKPMLAATAVLVLLFAALPTATVLAVGLTPTLVALIVDVTPGRYLMRCVAGLNLAGVAPFLFKLWSTGHDMANALRIVTDAYAWLAMYGAASLGWLLFLGLPGAVAVYRSLNAKRRIHMLRARQKELLDEWGDAIRPPGETAAGDDGAAVETAKAAAPPPPRRTTARV